MVRFDFNNYFLSTNNTSHMCSTFQFSVSFAFDSSKVYWDDHGYLCNYGNNKNNSNSEVTFIETWDNTEHIRWFYSVVFWTSS